MYLVILLKKQNKYCISNIIFPENDHVILKDSVI